MLSQIRGLSEAKVEKLLEAAKKMCPSMGWQSAMEVERQVRDLNPASVPLPWTELVALTSIYLLQHGVAGRRPDCTACNCCYLCTTASRRLICGHMLLTVEGEGARQDLDGLRGGQRAARRRHRVSKHHRDLWRVQVRAQKRCDLRLTRKCPSCTMWPDIMRHVTCFCMRMPDGL